MAHAAAALRAAGLVVILALAAAAAGCGDGGGDNGAAAGDPGTDAPAGGVDDLQEVTDRGVLRVGLEAAYPPFETVDSDGEIVGFDVDLCRAVAERLGVELELVNSKWDGLVPSLQGRSVDVICSGMSITDEREESVDFTRPYHEIGQVVLVRRDRMSEWDGLADLNREGVTVAVQTGTTGEFAARDYLPAADIQGFESAPDAAAAVLGGATDCMVFDDPFLKRYVRDNPDTLAILGEPFTTEPIGMAVREGQAALRDRLNEVLDALEEDGVLADLRERWGL